MNRWWAILLLQLAACWPVWQWYVKRLWAGNGDDQWCLLPAVAAITLLFLEGRKIRKHQESASAANIRSAGRGNLLLPTLLLLLYASTFHWLPPLLRATIVMVALGLTMSQFLLQRSLPLPLTGLLLLSLPVIPLLQFYLGFPLRVLVGAITAPLLQLSGVAVLREGTALNWNGQLIAIDAPCSGIKMLWAGVFLLCLVAWFYRLSAIQSLLAAAASLAVIVAGNILRAASLFYLEAGIVHPPISPALAHQSVGIVTFVFVAVGIVMVVRWLHHFHFAKELCEISPRLFSPVS